MSTKHCCERVRCEKPATVCLCAANTRAQPGGCRAQNVHAQHASCQAAHCCAPNTRRLWSAAPTSRLRASLPNRSACTPCHEGGRAGRGGVLVSRRQASTYSGHGGQRLADDCVRSAPQQPTLHHTKPASLHLQASQHAWRGWLILRTAGDARQPGQQAWAGWRTFLGRSANSLTTDQSCFTPYTRASAGKGRPESMVRAYGQSGCRHAVQRWAAAAA